MELAAMEEKAQEDVVGLYCRAMNSQSFYMASHYFSENLVLDWFGRTIAGIENVLHFMFDEMRLCNHNIIEIKNYVQNKDHIHRALGRFRQPEKEDYESLDDSGFFAGSYDSNSGSEVDSPCTKMSRRLSGLKVTSAGEEDIFKTPLPTRSMALQPITRPSMALKRLKHIDMPVGLDFVNAAGIISMKNEDFAQPGPAKVYTRPCHIQIGYTFRDSLCISLLIYNSDMPCRRNLSQIFDKFE